MERLASTSHPAHKNIGVIGLGIIGRGVAAHLRRKGFEVFVWNRSPRPVPNFVGSPGELANLCDVIEIFVSDDEALLQTVERLSADLSWQYAIERMIKAAEADATRPCDRNVPGDFRHRSAR